LGEHKFVACNVSKNVSGEIFYLIEEIDSMSFAECEKPNILNDLEFLSAGAFVLREGNSLLWKIESLHDWTVGNQLRCIVRNGDMSEDVLLADLKFLDLSTSKQTIATLSREHIETRRSFLRDWQNANDIVKRIREVIEKEKGGAFGVTIADLESTICNVVKEYEERGTFALLDSTDNQTDRIRNAMSYVRAYLVSLRLPIHAKFIAGWPKTGRLKDPENAWRVRFFGKAIKEEPKLGYITKTLFFERSDFIELYVGLGFKFFGDNWEPLSPPPHPYEMEADLDIEVDDVV
jgi:hypothetical protein